MPNFFAARGKGTKKKNEREAEKKWAGREQKKTGLEEQVSDEGRTKWSVLATECHEVR